MNDILVYADKYYCPKCQADSSVSADPGHFAHTHNLLAHAGRMHLVDISTPDS